MNRLKELRKQNGYKTQGDLAKVLFVNQTAVSQWERGVTLPSTQMLLKLSELYGESIEYLLGQTDQREEKQPTPVSEDELSPLDQQLSALLAQASDETKKAMILLLQQMQKP